MPKVTNKMPIDMIALTTLFAAAAAKSAAPGPGVILIFSRAASCGWQRGLRVSLGLMVADILLVFAALLVVAGTLALSGTMFEVLRWGGVAVLVGLALTMLRPMTKDCARNEKTRATPRRRGDLCSGILLGLSSPYNLVFLVALMPQYFGAGEITITDVLGITVAVIAGARLSHIFIILLGISSGRLSGKLARRAELTGAVLLLLFAGGTTVASLSGPASWIENANATLSTGDANRSSLPPVSRVVRLSGQRGEHEISVPIMVSRQTGPQTPVFPHQ